MVMVGLMGMNPGQQSLILKPCQIRMARAALNWTLVDLQKCSGVSTKTIRRLESNTELPNVGVRTLTKLMNCFAQAGLAFLPDENGHGVGVYFRSPEFEPSRTNLAQEAKEDTLDGRARNLVPTPDGPSGSKIVG